MPKIRLSLALIAITLAASAYAQGSGALLAGEWKGTYTCNQGNTGLTLTIREESAPTVDATFFFYPVDGNPGVPSGTFVMRGTFDVSNGTLKLDPSHWLDMPQGYVMVGLEGQLGFNGKSLNGKVLFSGCTDFALARSEALAPGGMAPTSQFLGPAP
jgi:hypothetical protein